MPGLIDPVDPRLARALRAAALELRDRRRVKRFAVEVSVGGLGLPPHLRAHYEVRPDDQLDAALRADIAAALVARAGAGRADAVAWLARPGPLGWHDEDAAWLPALASAYAEASRTLDVAVVVTKSGWYDPRSGLRREWQRLRYRSAARPEWGPAVARDPGTDAGAR